MKGANNLKLLIFLLGTLLVVKFLIIPVTEWQDGAISALNIEKIRLQKMRNLVNSEAQLSIAGEAYDAELAILQAALYSDSESLKLDAQTELMEIFATSELSVRSFNWVIDSSGLHRTLRAKINYRGAFANAIQMQWTLAASPRMFRIVDSRHILKPLGQDPFGVAEVFLTLELYALSDLGGDSDV